MRDWDNQTRAMVAAMVVAAWAGVSLAGGAAAWGLLSGADVPASPVALVTGLLRGTVTAQAGLWVCVALVAAAIVTVVVGARRMVHGGLGGGRRLRGDEAASLTGRASQTRALGRKAVAAKAERLGVTGGAVGLPIGRAVAGGRELWSSMEDVCTIIAGPRTGKTTCWVVPRIDAAPGAVVATSNKRDIVDITRDQRAERGHVWVFDPQQIADEPQSWWWDPMTYVTDAVAARALVEVFVDATRDPSAQTSAYFDSAARDLVAAMILAAARSGRPITALHRWLTNQTDDEPVQILRQAGESMMADTLQGNLELPGETRGGVYGTASTIMSFMTNEQAMRWVTPNPMLTQFRPEEFVASSDSLYLLSQEGPGSAAPVMTALTVAVTEAALERAKHEPGGRLATEPGGRLATPMVVVLDEAANVCRWRQLPSQYSHFGSRGVLVDTVLQSWSQGESAWSREGMRKLWSASNVKVYGGGVSERDFLAELSDLIGKHWVDSRQVSRSAQGTSRSVSRGAQERAITTVSDLQELPAGRAWVLASQSQAVLTRMVPFWERTKARTSKKK